MPVGAALSDLLTDIRARRSIRTNFRREPVSREVISEILECGLAAPSSKNSQSWRFHVVADTDILDAIAGQVLSAGGKDDFVPVDPLTGSARRIYDSSVRESAHILEQVPVAIVIENLGRFSHNRQVLASTNPMYLQNALLGYSLEMIGIGAAIENMWLATNLLGLGAVFMRDVLIAEASIKKILHISGDIVGALGLGYYDHYPIPPKTIKDSRVRYVE